MEIIISHKSSEPIYEQIGTQIKDMILNGELNAGDMITSVRALARQLKVGVLTVQKAYVAESLLFGMSISICAGSVSIAVLYLSKNAFEKMELLTVFSYITAVALVVGINKAFGILNRREIISKMASSVMAFILSALVCVVSYKISVDAFNKRDIM